MAHGPHLPRDILPFHKSQLDFGPSENVPNRTLVQVRINRHGNSTDLLRPQIDKAPLWSITGNNGNRLASLDAKLAQAVADAVNLLAEFLSAVRSPSARFAIDERLGLGILLQLMLWDIE